jgi:hypothetical protein
MLVTDLEGWVTGGRAGLFDDDTRFSSTYFMTIDDLPLRFLTAHRPSYNAIITTYTNQPFSSGLATVNELELLIKLSRVVDVGLRETLEITSYAAPRIRFRLKVSIECSFDDIFEARGLRATPPRLVRSHYDEETCLLRLFFRD